MIMEARKREFIEDVAKRVEEKLGGIIVIDSRIKNGVEYLALTYKESESAQICPSICLPLDVDKDDIDEVVNGVVNAFTKSVESIDSEQLRDITSNISDFEKIKSNVFVCVQDKDRNIRQDVVRQEYMNLYKYARILKDDMSVCVTKNLLEVWGIDEAILFDVAMENTTNNAYFEDLLVTMSRLAGMPVLDIACEHSEMLYCGNKKVNKYGAGVLCCNDFFKKIFNVWEETFYVIPSSIHEVLVVRNTTDGMPVSNIKDMIGEINGTVVSDEEVLADALYFFDGNDLMEVIIG